MPGTAVKFGLRSCGYDTYPRHASMGTRRSKISECLVVLQPPRSSTQERRKAMRLPVETVHRHV